VRALSQSAALGGLVVALAACGSGRTATRSGGATEVAFTVAQARSSPREPGPSALADPTDPRLPRPLVDVREIISGGPPPDGIPALDRPRFEHASTVRWLASDEPVLAFTLRGETRAYPVEVIISGRGCSTSARPASSTARRW
jgi:hypothetical protein